MRVEIVQYHPNELGAWEMLIHQGSLHWPKSWAVDLPPTSTCRQPADGLEHYNQIAVPFRRISVDSHFAILTGVFRSLLETYHNGASRSSLIR